MTGPNGAVERLLLKGHIRIRELSPWGSNYTFIVDVEEGRRGGRCMAVYKPGQGEAPLWDFPSGSLYKRERAAYLLSNAMGWDLVPLTVIRDGPHGVGSVQLFIDHDPQCNYFTLRKEHAEAFRTMACFDLVANNADRKAGHCIEAPDGHIWGIDHGLTFHMHLKLRTVIWDFCGDEIPERLLDDLRRLKELLRAPAGDIAALLRLISREEAQALGQRVDWLLATRTFPVLDRYRNVPRPPF